MQMCLPDTQVQGRQSPCQLWEARRVRRGESRDFDAVFFW